MSTKIKIEMSTFALHIHAIFFTYINRVVNRLKKPYSLSWMRVRISYHIFDNLSKLINGYLSAKIGWVILSQDLMDIECKGSPPSKVNRKCVYEDKYRGKCLI